MATVAPLAANAAPMAAPIPDAPPVMRATLSSSRKSRSTAVCDMWGANPGSGQDRGSDPGVGDDGRNESRAQYRPGGGDLLRARGHRDHRRDRPQRRLVDADPSLVQARHPDTVDVQ